MSYGLNIVSVRKVYADDWKEASCLVADGDFDKAFEKCKQILKEYEAKKAEVLI